MDLRCCGCIEDGDDAIQIFALTKVGAEHVGY